MEEPNYKELYLNRIRKDISDLIEFLTSKDVAEQHLREAFLEAVRQNGTSEKLKELL